MSEDLEKQLRGEIEWALRRWQHTQPADILAQNIMDCPALSASREKLAAVEGERDELKNGLWRFWNQKAREYLDRAEAAEARATAAEGEVAKAKKAAQDYCWQRYKGRDPLNLKSPAVFTSHEWQKIGEAIDAALTKEPGE